MSREQSINEIDYTASKSFPECPSNIDEERAENNILFCHGDKYANLILH
jgi:hypothetical protein